MRRGKAVPEDWNSENPAGRVVNVNFRWGKRGVRAERTRAAAYTGEL